MKKTLVIGGGGFIGRNLVDSLLRQKDTHVTAADLREGSNWNEIINDKEKSQRFTAIINDFSMVESFESLGREYDEVYMLAAVVGVNRTLKYPHDVIRINTSLTMNTLDWISRSLVKKILFASSSENYAGNSDFYDIPIPTPEKIPLCISNIDHPRWTYAVTKIHGESAFLHSSKSHNYECKIVRYQNIIGPEMGFGHAIPHIVERFHKAEEYPFKIYGHNQTRAFCYIDDAINGTIGAMQSRKKGNKIYHIGAPVEINMEQLTTYIGELMGYKGKYEYAMTYPGSVARRCPDISNAKLDFNYSPSIEWKAAVKKTVQWYKEFFDSGEKPPTIGFESPEKIIKKINNDS